MADTFIAIDWGTTNRRIYVITDGGVVDSVRDDRGVMAMADGNYAAEVSEIRARHGDWNILIAGMAGSNRGWQEARYVSAPAQLSDLAQAILWVEPGRTGIIPGVAAMQDRPDVMRGEEVQLLGAVAANLVPQNALLCQPGTHCKWAVMQSGMISSFTTAMTGELFAMLRHHSLLSTQLEGDVIDGPAFREGVRNGRDTNLQSSLFGVRAAALLERRIPADAPSYTSGLLIGNDVAARNVAGKTAHILADPDLGGLYASAVEELGGAAVIVDSQASFVAGITAIRALTR